MRAGLISNPHSARNRKRLDAIDARLNGRVTHRVSHDLDDIAAIVREFADAGIELLGINGGDGTVHRVLTEMAAIGRADYAPRLALLPGGSTNMTARDLNGAALSLPDAMTAFLHAVEGSTTVTYRSAVRVASERRPAQIGFCFGMGAIIRGIEYCHERIFSLGIRKEWASGAALLRAAWGIARREPVFAEGVALTVQWDDEVHEGRSSIFLVSALEELFLGIRPFWGQGDGVFATTWVAEDAARFLRTLPALLRGDASRLHADQGYLSRRVTRVAIRGGEQYTIDGEIYASEGPITVDGTPPFAIACLGAAA